MASQNGLTLAFNTKYCLGVNPPAAAPTSSYFKRVNGGLSPRRAVSAARATEKCVMTSALMSSTDIGSSVSPEKLSGNTRGAAGAAGAVGRPAFVFGFAGVGSFEALSKIAPRSLPFGEESIPVSTITCDRAGVAVNTAATKRTAVRTRGFLLTRLFCGRCRVIASALFSTRRRSKGQAKTSGDAPRSVPAEKIFWQKSALMSLILLL